MTCAHAGSPGTASGGPPTVPAGAPKVGSEQTKTDLDTAMHGEATAYAKCTLWGEHAAKEGSADVGRLFTGTAGVERQEHFAERAGLAESSAPVVSLAAAALLAGVARLDRPTALLGMIAGGSAAAVACAEGMRADARLVAIMQYLRVALIAATAAASQADVPLVSGVQSIRLFCMVLLAPLLIRLAARWQDRPDERGHD
ncbi:hypothetical protein GCM10023191_098870 [Actinoallomurus oryzae]|uniref:Uncharacterized protein n=1 Tax=Actinoallomurus oryzae TaxID=502180 RepID=A0ABP8R8N2_9ACTN